MIAMATYKFNCHECTNKAHGGQFDDDYCLPTVRDGESPIVLHDMGKTSLDYFTCKEFTTKPRTAAIYELVRMEGGNQ